MTQICNSHSSKDNSTEEIRFDLWRDSPTWDRSFSDDFLTGNHVFYERIYYSEDDADDNSCLNDELAMTETEYGQAMSHAGASDACTRDVLCVGIIETGSDKRFKTISLKSEPEVPFIFSNIEEYTDYFNNGLTSSSEFFLDLPADFDHDTDRIFVKRYSPTHKIEDKGWPSLSAVDDPFYFESDEPEMDLIVFNESVCKSICHSNPNCFAFASFSEQHSTDLANSDGNYRCKLFDGSKQSTIKLYPAKIFYDYSTEYNIEYSNVKLYYRNDHTIDVQTELVEISNVS